MSAMPPTDWRFVRHWLVRILPVAWLFLAFALLAGFPGPKPWIVFAWAAGWALAGTALVAVIATPVLMWQSRRQGDGGRQG